VSKREIFAVDENEEKLLSLKLRMAEESVSPDYPDWCGARLPGIVACVIGAGAGMLLYTLVKGVSFFMIPVIALLCGAAVTAVAAFRPR